MKTNLPRQGPYVLSVLSVLCFLCSTAFAGEMSKPEAERILKDEQENANALFSVSFYFEQAGQPFSALRSVERAIEVDAKVPGYHARYGQLLVLRRRFKEAGAAYARAAELDPLTKAFRAAQARACASAGLLKDALEAWWKLLEGATEKKEILDAARQIEALCRQTQDPAGMEKVWAWVLPKWTAWNERLDTLDRLAEALRLQGHSAKAAELWAAGFKQEKNWDRRALYADRLAAEAAVAPDAQRAPLYEQSLEAWKTLLQAGAAPAQKQRAALRVANAHLQANETAKASEVLKPWVFASAWNENLGAVGLLAGCHALQGDAPARQALWREFMERSTTRLKLEAGKRYPIKVECLNQRADQTRTLRLAWTSPSQAKQIVPAQRLFSSAEAKAGDGLKGEYFDLDFRTLRTTRVDPVLNFTWDLRTLPVPGVPARTFAVRWTGFVEAQFTEEYVFFTQSDDPVRVWIDGKLALERWAPHALSEDNTLGLERRLPAARALALALEWPAPRVELWREEAKAFPYYTEVRRELAEALAATGRHGEALDEYDLFLSLLKEQTGAAGDALSGYVDRQVQICIESGDLHRALQYLIRSTTATAHSNDYWRIQNWLNQIQGAHGFYAALDAVERLGSAGGLCRLGAAFFLQNQGHPNLARPLLEACAADGNLQRPQRRQAFQGLIGNARGNEARINLARQLVALGGEFWDRQQDYTHLIMWLGQDGRIEQALQTVREADQLQQNQWRGGPQALQNLSSYFFQGQRVGPGLRTPEGQEQAERALLVFAREVSGRQDFLPALVQFTSQLAELHARRGDYDGAVDLLHAVAKIKDAPLYHLPIAGLLERKGDLDAAWKEHLAYLDLEAARYSDDLKKSSHNRTWLGNAPDGRFSGFLEKQKKFEALGEHVKGRLAALAGLGREAFADTVVALYKGLGRPEEMVALLKKMQALGHKPPVYQTELQWAEGAIKMKNASSQADTRMRDQLLQAVETWKKTFAQNPEDYAAALNIFKNFMLLGRRKDAEPFLEQALAVAPEDPIVLDLWGSQRMLDKDYAGAARAFGKAGAVSSRPEDFERSVVSAFELSGNSKEALARALDSLASGRHQGRGVRTVEEILDLAERSDLLPFLHEKIGTRVKALRDARQPVREGLAQLALRLAWDHQDEALAAAVLDELILQSRSPLTPWQEDWRLRQLADRAMERRRVPDAVRIRRALLDAGLARGLGPDPSLYREIAGLLLEAGQSQEAAELLFDGLESAVAFVARGVAPLPVQPPVSTRGRRGSGRQPSKALGGDVRSQWAAVILGLAGQEAVAGGKNFRTACGDRLAPLIDYDLGRLEQAPEAYSGALLDLQVESVFELREKVNAAYRKAAESPAASPAIALARARRLIALATRQPAEARDKSVTLDAIRESCQAAVAKAEPRGKRRVQETVAGLYAALFGMPEQERLAGVTPALVLDAYEACSEEKRVAPETLARAMGLAESCGEYARAAGYGRELLALFPGDRKNRRNLTRVLLFAGQVKEAAEALRGGLDQHAGYTEYREAGEGCLATPPAKPNAVKIEQTPAALTPAPAPAPAPAPEAAAAAVEFLGKAIALYLVEVGPQVDAKGKPLPDAELSRMQGALSRASAWSGKLEDALSQLLASVFNSGAAPTDPQILATVAQMYARAGRTRELAGQLETKITAEPRSAALRLALATVLEQAGEWNGAAFALRAGKALDPQLPTVKRLIAALRKAGDAHAALDECREWAASIPRDAEVYRTMAEIHKDAKDEEGEVRSLTMLVEVAPRDAENCRSVAVLFAGRKDFPRAIALLERAVELRGEEPYRHVDLAEVLHLAGQSGRAESVLKEALTRDWEKGLSPELLARMPQWKGTYEARADALLAEIYEALKQPEAAARARMKLPAGYKRPALEQAIPTPTPRWWAWRGPGGGRRGWGEE